MLNNQYKFIKLLLIIGIISLIISCEKKEYTSINFATNNTFFTITIEKKFSDYAENAFKEAEKNVNAGYGIAIDKAASYLKDNGVKDFTINFSGNVISYGKKNNSLFPIGITNPLDKNNIINTVIIENSALATYPTNNQNSLESDLYASVSVVSNSGEKAQILAQSYYTLEIDDLNTVCRENDTPVLIVKKDGTLEKLCNWEKIEYK